MHHKKSLVPVCAKVSIGRLFDDTKSCDKNIEYPNLNTISNLEEFLQRQKIRNDNFGF